MSKLSDKLIQIVYTKNLTDLDKFLETDELISGTDNDERTALMHAILDTDYSFEVIKALIASGVNINIKDKEQSWTALAFAARDCGQNICKVLLDAGADIDAVDTFGNTPLFRAVMAGKEDNIELLVSYGANPDVENNSGVSPRKLSETLGRHYFSSTT
ncbi:ankyrin repeat domain-containing protein [Sulfurovum sp. AR]|uniref:ankyrin repeat domain-containing protein n=1 Tax=Sulfurovum sp. AR TaxID=1165841 RepID=UPI00025C47FF|nr:ankyrin repeat domain-containing protein [Sulfurovum sp. AR]EIF51635.1 hypothetical protein SULAR_02188 [Sulfurovum sp. AR]